MGSLASSFESQMQHAADLTGSSQSRVVTASDTVEIYESLILVDLATGGENITLTLPDAAKVPGKVIDVILDSVSGGDALTVSCPGRVTQTVATLFVVAGDSARFESNGQSWMVCALLSMWDTYFGRQQ